MASLVLLVAALAAASSTQAYEIRRAAPVTSASLATEVLPNAQYSLPFTGKAPRSRAKKAALSALSRKAGNYTSTVAGAEDVQEYLTDITIGGQDFKVVIDTGS